MVHTSDYSEHSGGRSARCGCFSGLKKALVRLAKKLFCVKKTKSRRRAGSVQDSVEVLAVGSCLKNSTALTHQINNSHPEEHYLGLELPKTSPENVPEPQFPTDYSTQVAPACASLKVENSLDSEQPIILLEEHFYSPDVSSHSSGQHFSAAESLKEDSNHKCSPALQPPNDDCPHHLPSSLSLPEDPIPEPSLSLPGDSEDQIPEPHIPESSLSLHENCVPASPLKSPTDPLIEEALHPSSHTQQEVDTGDWHLVCNKKKKNRENKTNTHTQTPKAVVAPVPKATKDPKAPKTWTPRKDKAAAPASNKHHAPDSPTSKCHTKVLYFWPEDKVQEVLQVAPNMRRHVIGPRGETIARLRREYPSVRVKVPSPDDPLSKEVVLKGLKSQVSAAAKDITSHLQDIEAKLREAAQRRQAMVHEELLQVAPSMRRYVVGAGGEALVRLAQEHPSVRVAVPPPTDTTTTSITIRGPPAQVTAVKNIITSRLRVVQ